MDSTEIELKRDMKFDTILTLTFPLTEILKRLCIELEDATIKIERLNSKPRIIIWR